MAARRKDNQSTLNFEIVGIIFISLSLLVFLCLIMPDAGALTRLLEKMLRAVTGQGRYIIPLLLAYFGVRLLQKRSKTSTPGRFGGGLLLFVAALGILHLFLSPGELWQRGLAGEGGGLIGALLSYILRGSLGLPGAVIVLLAAILVGLILTAEVPAAALLTPFRNGKNYSRTVKEWMVGYFFVDEEIPVARPVIIDNNLDHERHGESEHEGPEQEETDDKEVKNSQSLEGDSCLDIDQDGEENDGNGEGASPLRLVPRREFDGKGMAGGAVEVRSNMPRRHQSEYELPPFSLLSRPARGKIIGRASKDIADNIKILEETLENFGVRAKVTQVSRGPVITRYEIQPPAGVKVSRIVSLADDIALSMAAPDVRIEAPIPGKAALGIEVPNKVISMVHLRELLESKEFKEATSKLTVVLGRDIAGAPVLGDLTSMPHLLIAGATGSGKSVCLNTIISSILFRATPEQVKFLIIDPKMVELATYNGIPHLISPVVTEPKKAATSLRWAVKEMEYRYELFAAAGVRDINRYNSAAARDRRGLLPLLVVIIDELADLMMVAPADVEDSVCRLAQMARAAGMHLVVATQRPSVDVITGLIKANIPSRLSFAVSSQIDSRTILDTGGAEKLLGKGDMLFFPVGASKPVRLQGAFLSDREVEALVHYWKRQADPVYDESIISGDNGAGGTLAPEDELLPRAVEIFIETGHASISLLQRRLHIGYSRAARLIDIMEKKGIVGGYEGSKPRSVLITLEQFQQCFKDTRN